MKGLGLVVSIVHWVILTLCIYTVLCCGFHVLPAWGTSKDYESINHTLLSIALSYISAYIFYIVFTRIPSKQREKKVYEIWRSDIAAVYDYMGDIITSLLLYGDIEGDLIKVNIKTDDCKKLSCFEPERKHMFHHIRYFINGEEKGHPVGEFIYYRDQIISCENVEKSISRMINSPLVFHANKDLTTLLSNIRTSRYIRLCHAFTRSSNDKIPSEWMEMPSAIVEYIDLYKKLSKYTFDKRTYYKTAMTEEEIVKHLAEVQKAIETSKALYGEEMFKEIMKSVK